MLAYLGWVRDVKHGCFSCESESRKRVFNVKVSSPVLGV